MENIKAVIFDMDGVIINSMPYHKQAWNLFCKNYGFSLTEEDFEKKIYGRINDDVLKLIFKKELSKEELDKYSNEKELLYQNAHEPNLKTLNGLIPFLEHLDVSGIKKAIATSAPTMNVDFIMKKLDLRKHFQAIVDPSDITKGKPDPEIYLTAAQKLSIKPEHCVVFEDSYSGIEAAKNAGMHVIGVASTHSRKELQEKTKLIIDDFSQINRLMLF